jgi:hypothetical protein
MLNIPSPLVTNGRRLYIGMGGGYDVLGAVPLYTTLDKWCTGRFTPVMANIGPIEFGHLSNFYSLAPTGAPGLRTAIQAIVDEEQIETIIAVDGGVDCLMRGDEQNAGTVLQDFITLAALDQVKVPKQFLACLGFGCETEEELNFFRVLENIATLTRTEGFLGTCSLLPSQESFSKYKEACETSFENRRKSHIHTRVIAAVEGQFGNVTIDLDANLSQLVNTNVTSHFINPLMGMYWFFNLHSVIASNLLIPVLRTPETMKDAFHAFRQHVKRTRDYKLIPL